MVRGTVVYLYAFDVGSEVVTAAAGGGSTDGEVRRKPVSPRDIPAARPQKVELPPTAAVVAGVPAETGVRAYEVGVVTVTVRLSGVAGELAGWRRFHRPTTADGRPLAETARDLCRQACDRLGAALRDPAGVGDPEAYTAFCLSDLGGDPDAARWLGANRRAVAGLLNDADPDRLSDDQVAESFRHQRSFAAGDAVVPDWDAALVVDLTGEFDDVLLVLELANLQLEELRTLDAALDRHLDRAYDHLGRRPGLWPGRWAAVLRELRRLRVDASKLADAVTNVTKFVGDWYLARVYLAARERFHLDDWRASVDQRVAQLDRVYELIRGEVAEQRMFVLELLVAALIALEILLALVLRG
ncbi:hypothetical protein [Urbifossiella limnaea]|uniref:DUF155 domain-containing protein n=1 Tax=Urbifossiella limnaea TaxID=2528023 RepID=A0A517XMH7_9BACT|nr:hypothetical protein [Urbifossiella limnaea]QDU18719.1 hypothetical protein ETAA1_06120 [Urbifossiella limnaea]